MHHPIRIRALRLGLAACLLAGALAGLASANAPTYETTILFTHDTHDHFLPMPDEEGGEYGGYTRLATLIQQERAAHPDALVLDAGDFSMGSLFQTIYATEAPELRALGAMGYDATTLGNHEFDYRARGLAEMLNAAVESGDPVPPIVQANYKLPAEDADTWAAWNRYGIGDYLILERGGVNYGIFGLMGEEADSNAPMSGMEFEPAADAAERTVASLEEELLSRNAPYFIICLSHSGTDGRGKGEDYELARRVDGIDVILSGHTHGGQLGLPLVRDLLLPPGSGSYAKGSYPLGEERSLQVTSGVGVTKVPARLFDPPEVVLLQIVPGQKSPS